MSNRKASEAGGGGGGGAESLHLTCSVHSTADMVGPNTVTVSPTVESCSFGPRSRATKS